MKKVIFISLFFSSLLFVGCGETPTPTFQEDVATASYTKFGEVIPINKSKKIILKAGEEAGWKMTEFKDNAIIAEKLHDNANATAVTVHINENGFELEPSNNDLQSLLESNFN